MHEQATILMTLNATTAATVASAARDVTSMAAFARQRLTDLNKLENATLDIHGVGTEPNTLPLPPRILSVQAGVSPRWAGLFVCRLVDVYCVAVWVNVLVASEFRSQGRVERRGPGVRQF